jgi:hypothetical protein
MIRLHLDQELSFYLVPTCRSDMLFTGIVVRIGLDGFDYLSTTCSRHRGQGAYVGDQPEDQSSNS